MEIERKFLTSLNSSIDSIIDFVGTNIPTEDYAFSGLYTLERSTLMSTGDGGYTRVTKKYDPRADFVDYMLTVKGPGSISRAEVDVPLTECQYIQFINDFNLTPCAKIRLLINYKGNLWELDIFEDGLVLAEIELSHESQQIDIPPFVTDEVTGDMRYYNYKPSS